MTITVLWRGGSGAATGIRRHGEDTNPPLHQPRSPLPSAIHKYLAACCLMRWKGWMITRTDHDNVVQQQKKKCKEVLVIISSRLSYFSATVCKSQIIRA
jgi:hypothetical protein